MLPNKAKAHKTETISAKVYPEVFDWVNKKADENGVSQSGFLNDLLIAIIENEKAVTRAIGGKKS